MALNEKQQNNDENQVYCSVCWFNKFRFTFNLAIKVNYLVFIF